MMVYWEVTQGQGGVRRGGEVGKLVKGVSPGQLDLGPTGVSEGLPSVTCSHPCWVRGGGDCPPCSISLP